MIKNEKQLIIALAADLNYETQLTTLIKSICYQHKKFNIKIKIYLLHKTFPNEWFVIINEKLKKINAEIISFKIDLDLSSYKTLPHITEATFYRLFIPYIPEERVIYLDSDIIVNNNLLDLMEISFNNKSLLAVEDFYLNNIDNSYAKKLNVLPYFNAGVLVFNVPLWKKESLLNNILNELKKENNNFIYADQDLLNLYLHNHWKKIDCQYNLQIGTLFNLHKQKNKIKPKKWLKNKPIIIHYTGLNKPWKINDNNLYRDNYWFYYKLSWDDVLEKI